MLVLEEATSKWLSLTTMVHPSTGCHSAANLTTSHLAQGKLKFAVSDGKG
jgi:hypothetical protein